MNSIRRFTTAFWLAFALLVGQQVAALHDLGHATELLSHKQGSKTPPATCDQCFACAQLSSAVGVTPPVLPVVAAGIPVGCFARDATIRIAPRLAFRSRAPPTLL
ncbi:MAG TPA: hypothetical protein VII36_07600 [Usitatibacter sp.]